MKNKESKDPCTFCGTRDPSVRRRVFRGDPTLGTYSVPACDACTTARIAKPPTKK